MSELSNTIKQRLQEAGVNFNANHNISAYVSEDERAAMQLNVEAKMQELLEELVIDTANDHNTNETAKRVAKMFVRETFSGRYEPAPKVTAFPNASQYDQMYITGPISIRSVCAHHFQNIKGKCWIGIFPGEEVIGLSKFNRLVHWVAERPQIQEEMSMQIADIIEETTKAAGVAVVMKAEHMCMTARGVKEHESDMTTSVMRGKFISEPTLKSEFLSLLQGMKGFSE